MGTLAKLKQKQEAIEAEHFAEVEQEMIAGFDQAYVNRAYEIRGAIRALNAITQNLMSQHIRGLMHVEEEKLWRVYGNGSFADYLSTSEEVGMSKTRYYELKTILLETNDETLDAVTGAKISPRKIKALLDKNISLAVEDGSLVVGSERVPTSDPAAMTTLIDAVHLHLRDRDVREEKKDRKIETLESKVERGEEENEELRRNLDGIVDTSRIQRAYLHAINALLLLTEAVGELDDAEKAERGPEDLQQVVIQYHRLSDAYGVNQPIDRHTIDLQQKVAAMKPVEEMTEAEKKETFVDRAMARIDLSDLD